MTQEQPTGTVTLVFTDIEGSTRLLDELGEGAYRDALGEHRRVVREAFGRHAGYEVDYEGDAFFYAFSSAESATSAVREAMTGLAGGPIRIRVGIHTGGPGLDPPKYVGRDVHLAARVMSAAHGGQVLLSRTTRELVEVEALDLGEHRLKDFDEPVTLFQLGEGAFPPLKTISNTNLPRPVSSFVGRDQEVAELVGLIRDGVRLVTLTGPGGSGKTRLAIEAAAELVPTFRAGVFWVGLASLRDPALVVETIGQTLGAKGALADHIGEREMLLLLDNLEQVIEVAPDLATLVEACPNLVLLVTSRELLRVRGEVEYQVLPLAQPDAVELFCARAGVEPSAAVEELCRRLDSMPLALELAAARTGVLTVEQIVHRLLQRLDLFKGGRDADPRQQTLRATIEWSHDLLAEDEQQLFARLSVFAGGCTLDAAERVAGAELDSLQSLVDKSLVRHAHDRFWMLETIRDYAHERLEGTSHAADVRDRLADWALEWAAAFDPDQPRSLARVREDLPNIRAALEGLLATNRACDGLRLASNLSEAMFQFGAVGESHAWLERTLEASEDCPVELRARALAHAALQATFSGDPELGERRAAEAAALMDTSDLDRYVRCEVLVAESVAQLGLGNLDEAERLTGAALAFAEHIGHAGFASDMRLNLGYVQIRRGNLDGARGTSERALADARARGDGHVAAAALHNLFLVAVRCEDAVTASRRLLEMFAIMPGEAGATIPFAVEGAAALAARAGDHELAATLLGATPPVAARVYVVELELRLEAERAACAALGREAFGRLFASGSRLSLDEAADRAAKWLADRAASGRS